MTEPVKNLISQDCKFRQPSKANSNRFSKEAPQGAFLVRSANPCLNGKICFGLTHLGISNGGCSSKVERLFVEQKVAGALPVSHPIVFDNYFFF